MPIDAQLAACCSPSSRRPGPSRRSWPGASTEPGLRQAHGFSLNASNHLTTAENTAYGNAVMNYGY
ncbi:hypothetical protein OHU10_47690 [Streptomyces europaeiscabiei]|nr:hypothetical protein [Streptomyces europaeiscabiei]